MVTAYLGQRGFTVIDADDVAHQVVAPNRPAWRSLRDAFGDAVLAPDRTIDRAFLADVVFHDQSALARLNAITHGHIGAEIGAQLERASGPAAFVALPIFRPEHRQIFHLTRVWGVLVAPEVALHRLVEQRGLDERDARARLENQPTNEQRLAIVDDVISTGASTGAAYR
jgi:dephospho-CoA kinase